MPEQQEPTALDRLDPSPVPPRQPRRRRRVLGDRERGVRRDLRLLPDELRLGGIAAGILGLARDLDMGIVAGRDAAAHQREIRQGLTTLRELAPGERKGDKTDDLAARREARLTAAIADELGG